MKIEQVDFLELTTILLKQYQKNDLEESLKKYDSFLLEDFVSQLLDSAQECVVTGHMGGADALLKIAHKVIEYKNHKRYYPYLYNQYTNYYLYTNNNAKAKQSIKKAFELSPFYDDNLSQSLKVNLGLTMFRDGEYKSAIEFYQNALKNDIITTPALVNSTKLNLSICYAEVGDFEKTIDVLKGLENSNINDEDLLSKVYGNLSNYYGRLGRRDKEREYLLLSLRLSKKQTNPNWHTLLNNYLNLTFYYLKVDDFTKASYYLELFRNYAIKINTSSYILSYARVKIKMLLDQGLLKDAEAIVDKHYPKFAQNDTKDYEYLSFLGVSGLTKLASRKYQESRDFIQELLDTSIQTGHKEFEQISYGYLGIVQYMLGDVSKGIANIKKTFLYEVDLRDGIANEVDQFFFSSNISNMYKTTIEVLILNQDTKLLFDILQNIKSTALTYKIEKKELNIPLNSVFVDYYIKDELAFCLVVCNESDTPIFINLDTQEEELKQTVERYQDSLKDARYALFENPFEFLDTISKKLLEPLAKYIKTKEIIIFSRSSYLNYLPFQILKYEDKFLIEHIAVSYTLHSSLISSENREYKEMDIIVSQIENDTEKSKENMLKESNKIKTISSKYFDTNSLINDKNSYDIIESKLFEILHLINHGSFIDKPLNSGFYLKKQNKDTFISIDQLFTSELLKAKFIFMSGCDTGRVHSLKGEEVLGIISYLHSQGTKTAILSFWEILADIDTTVDIVEDFYKFWLEDKNMKAIALQKAMLKNKNSVNPYDWAGYALFGEGF